MNADARKKTVCDPEDMESMVIDKVNDNERFLGPTIWQIDHASDVVAKPYQPAATVCDSTVCMYRK